MKYTPPNSFWDIAERLKPIQQTLKNAAYGLGYSQDDVRGLTLRVCESALGANIIMLNVLTSLQLEVIPPNQQRLVLGLETGSIPKTANNISHYLRLSMMSFFLFSVENMFVNILARIAPTKVRRGYAPIVKALLEEITLEDKEEKEKILNTIAHMRNSLHSGGVHNNDTFEVIIDDYPFKFDKGQPVSSAGWGQMAIALKAMVEVIIELLDAPEIRKEVEPISTMYVEERKKKSKRQLTVRKSDGSKR